MSKCSVDSFVCPVCGHEGKIRIWDSINTVINPVMKNQVRTNEVFVYTCPKCNEKITVDYGFLYHQMEDLMMIYYVKNPEEVENVYKMFTSDEGMPMLGKQKADYLFRIVQSQNELREKLFIFDAELDDRVIELMKVYFFGLIQDEKPELAVDEIRFELGEDDSINFVFLSDRKPVANSVIEREFYESTEKEYISKRPDLRADDIIIDFAWATGVLEK